MLSKTNDRKYLVYQANRRPGLDHSLSVFKDAIKEAIHLDRTLVINKFSMDPIHNLGHPSENLEYKRYINLNKTQVYKAEQDGSLRQINSLFHFIEAENFNLNEYSEKDILLIDRSIRPVTEEENNQYDVIVRRTTTFYYNRMLPSILVSFYPSDKVEHLTDVVLKSLGTSLDNVKKRASICRGVDFSANSDMFSRNPPDTPLYYAALHVRVGDNYRYWPEYRYWNTRRHIKHIINYGRPSLKSRRIYIMSNIQDRRYFDFLKKDYNIYRYFDFPELEALVSKNNDYGVDNAMLYSVEKNILQYAYIKIVRAGHNSEIRYINSSFNIPLLSLYPPLLHRKHLPAGYWHRQFLAIIGKIPGIKWLKIAIRKIRRLPN